MNVRQITHLRPHITVFDGEWLALLPPDRTYQSPRDRAVRATLYTLATRWCVDRNAANEPHQLQEAA